MVSESARNSGRRWDGGMVVVVVISDVGALAHAFKDREARGNSETWC